MAFDTYLKLYGLPGEDVGEPHKDWIELLSWSWGASNTPASAHGSGGGGGAGKVSVHDLSFTKPIDKTSPLLLSSCCAGTHIKKAVLFVRKAGGEQQDYYQVTLSDCLVSSFQTGGGTQDPPLDRVDLRFRTAEVQVAGAEGSVVDGGCTDTP
jgi:type VI secretion system secreted protein Hcp